MRKLINCQSLVTLPDGLLRTAYCVHFIPTQYAIRNTQSVVRNTDKWASYLICIPYQIVATVRFPTDKPTANCYSGVWSLFGNEPDRNILYLP